MRREWLEKGLVLACLFLLVAGHAQAEDARIQPWPENPRYWQYQGEPILLLGASDDDNLFQHPDLAAHLDAIRAAGGNYIRNTMSDRDAGNVFAFAQLPDGRYDLGQWNAAYWERLDNLLQLTAERDIIVQIEVWDRFDFTDSKQLYRWQVHPFNPKNNVNYTYEESGFDQRYPDHPGQNKQPFFKTVPSLQNNQVVLKYQQRFIDKLLGHTLPYGHVLYCMDNETSGDEAWSVYWNQYIQRRAAEEGVQVCTTEMWDDWDIRGPQHRRTLDHPERYAFVDVSQNNHNRGDQHWDNLMWLNDYLRAHPRPVNTVKIYGADTGRYGTDADAVERFWRNLLAGCAAVRFHRPDSGLGLSSKSHACLQGARQVAQRVAFWSLRPHNELLAERAAHEAYLAADPGRAYVIYFPAEGQVELQMPGETAAYDLQWMDVASGRWHRPPQNVQVQDRWVVRTPSTSGAVAVIVKKDSSDRSSPTRQ